MTDADIILTISLLYGAFKGFKKGLILSVSSVIGLVLGIFFASKLSPVLRFYIREYGHFDIGKDYFSLVVAFFSVWAGTNILGKLLANIVSFFSLGGIDKFLGVVFGAFKFSIILALVISFLERQLDLKEYLKDSKVYSTMQLLGIVDLCADLFTRESVLNGLEVGKQIDESVDKVIKELKKKGVESVKEEVMEEIEQ